MKALIASLILDLGLSAAGDTTALLIGLALTSAAALYVLCSVADERSFKDPSQS